jgi:hypothetical protein
MIDIKKRNHRTADNGNNLLPPNQTIENPLDPLVKLFHSTLFIAQSCEES